MIVWKIFIVEFQGVGSVKCKTFSLKLLELTPFYDLSQNFEFFNFFLVKSILFQFSILLTFQNLDFQGKKNENLGESSAKWEEHTFVY